jgi:hypothetical protein
MNIYPWLRTDITTKYGVVAVSEMLTRLIPVNFSLAFYTIFFSHPFS